MHSIGLRGTIIAALIGTQVIFIEGLPDIKIPTTPPVFLIRALIGGIIFVAIWQVLTLGLLRGRSCNA